MLGVRARRLFPATTVLLALPLLGCSGDGGSSPQPPSRTESPAPPSAPGTVDAAALYTQLCAACHGPEGKGNGPGAAALPVKPADHTNAAVMEKISDAELFKAIKEGGAAVGKSPAMPPWGSTLRDEQMRALVVYVRSLSRRR